MRDGKSASKPNPHIFAQLGRMRKQLAACCKKLFLKVDKIAVKKPSKTQEGIIEKRPIVRMLAFRCGCAMLLISTSTWPLSRKSATPNNVVPTKDKTYAHYSWISGRCRLTHTDERKHKVTEKSRLPLQRSPGVVSCRVIVSVFESPKKAVNSQKILGVLIMILGAAAIKLL